MRHTDIAPARQPMKRSGLSHCSVLDNVVLRPSAVKADHALDAGEQQQGSEQRGPEAGEAEAARRHRTGAPAQGAEPRQASRPEERVPRPKVRSVERRAPHASVFEAITAGLPNGAKHVPPGARTLDPPPKIHGVGIPPGGMRRVDRKKAKMA